MWRRRRASHVGGEPPARTSQLGGRFPEGVRRQSQVVSAARTAVQQVAADVSTSRDQQPRAEIRSHEPRSAAKSRDPHSDLLTCHLAPSTTSTSSGSADTPTPKIYTRTMPSTINAPNSAHRSFLPILQHIWRISALHEEKGERSTALPP
jgi:hypothetical protein